MLYDYLKHKNLLETASIEETFDSLRIKINPCEPMASFVPKLFDELKTISLRDNFELFFDAEGNHVKISDCSSSSYKVIDGHIVEYGDDEVNSYEVDLKIRKNLADHTLSVYFLDEFSEFIDQGNPLNLINLISGFFDAYLKFEVYSTIEYFGSNTITFIEARNLQDVTSKIDGISREDKLDILFENSSVSNLLLKLVPSDFYLLNKSPNKKINLFFKKQCAALSLIFISNASEFKSDGRLSYKITGYKTISDDDVDLQKLSTDIKYLYRIYSWSYEGGSSTDKIGLARNVLSIHTDNEGKVRFDTEAWQAIRSNYQIYLKGNIQSYLEIKNKIGEFVIELSAKTYLMADDLLNSLKNNVFIFLTFILSVVVVNGLKDNGEIVVFSNAYLGIVIILSLVSFLWLWMMNKEIVNRFDSATQTVKQILNLNYNKLLMESEIDECVDPVIERNRRYLHGQLKRYSRWWIAILVVFVLSFIIANRYFHADEASSSIKAALGKSYMEDKKTPEKTMQLKSTRPSL